MKNDMIKTIAEKAGFKFNSLPKEKAQIMLALLILEETGIEKAEAISIVRMLDELATINYSAMRQKLNMVVYGKKAEKGEKESASLEEMLEDLV